MERNLLSALPWEIQTVIDKNRYLTEEGREGRNGCWARAHDLILALPVRIEWHPFPEEPGRFHREFQSCQRLAHPNILKTYDLKELEGCQGLVLEDFPADNLRDLLPTESFSSQELTRDVFGSIAEATAYAHGHGIIHRAIEPGRVWIRRQGQGIMTKLDGFGTAFVEVCSHRELESLAYFSPEQMRGEGVTSACDIYSLGVMLYEFSVGRRPFQAETIPKLAERILQAAVAWDGIAEELRPILDKCLRKNPEDRFCSVGDLMEALDLSPDRTCCPQRAKVHTLAGQDHYKAGRYVEAFEEWSSALVWDAHNSRTHNNLGTALDALGDWPRARNAYLSALELAPYDFVAHYNLASISQRQGHHVDAEAGFRKAAALNPLHAASVLNQGNALFQLGRSEEANACWQVAYCLEPEFRRLDMAGHWLGGGCSAATAPVGPGWGKQE